MNELSCNTLMLYTLLKSFFFFLRKFFDVLVKWKKFLDRRVRNFLKKKTIRFSPYFTGLVFSWTKYFLFVYSEIYSHLWKRNTNIFKCMNYVKVFAKSIIMIIQQQKPHCGTKCLLKKKIGLRILTKRISCNPVFVCSLSLNILSLNLIK